MISAVWIAKDEEKVIGRSIDSVKAAVDELIVVDTGSADGTAQAAQAHGARVEHFEWVNDFAAARNHALSLAQGDAVLMIDADEWFDPPLGAPFRHLVEDTFLPQKFNIGLFTESHVDRENGTQLGRQQSKRLLRGKGAVRYRGMVHEEPLPVQGVEKAMRFGERDCLLKHDGYGSAVGTSKMERNIALLKAGFEAAQRDDSDKALTAVYLMREYAQVDPQKALDYFQWCLDHPAPLNEALGSYVGLTSTFAAQGMELGRALRHKVSRRQIQRVVLPAVQRTAASFPDSETADLYYRSCFDFRESYLLQHLGSAIERAEKKRAAQKEEAFLFQYARTSSALYACAARAAYRRGHREQVFELAAAGLDFTRLGPCDSQVFRQLVGLLLQSVRGLPVQDVILFLGSKLDMSRQDNLEGLVASAQCEGFKDLYAYYGKKMMESGTAKRTDYYYFLTVLGKAQAAAEAAYAAREEMQPDLLARSLFLAVLCANSPQLLERYKAALGEYAAPLEAYFGGGLVYAKDMAIPRDNYHLIAFAAGLRAANRFLECYTDARSKFLIRFEYYYFSGLSADLLDIYPYTPASKDWQVKRKLVDACCAAGRYGQAWSILKDIPFVNGLDTDWANMTEIVAEKGDPASSREAVEMYEQYNALLEEHIDWSDVVNTQKEMPADSKKQRKLLEGITAAQLEQAAKPKERRAFVSQLRTCQKAAKAMEEAGSLCEAARLDMLLLGYEGQMYTYGTAERLRNIFAAVKNGEAVEWLDRYRENQALQAEREFEALAADLERARKERLIERQKRAFSRLNAELMRQLEEQAAQYPQLGALDWKAGRFDLFDRRAAALVAHRDDIRWFFQRLEGPMSKQVFTAILRNWTDLEMGGILRALQTDPQGHLKAGKTRLLTQEQLQEEKQREDIRRHKPEIMIDILKNDALWSTAKILDGICEGYRMYLDYLGDSQVPNTALLYCVHPDGRGE